jgi:hypothetical protein
MTRNLIRLLAATGAASIVLIAASASAQDRDRRAPNTEVTRHTFEDPDEIVGDTPSNQGFRVHIRLPNDTQSLIRYRTHFRDSLLKSVEIL